MQLGIPMATCTNCRVSFPTFGDQPALDPVGTAVGIEMVVCQRCFSLQRVRQADAIGHAVAWTLMGPASQAELYAAGYPRQF